MNQAFKPSAIFTSFESYIRDLQTEIVTALQSLEQQRPQNLQWELANSAVKVDEALRQRTGGGTARIIEAGTFFERAGVNVASVGTVLTEALATELGVERGRTELLYRAAGLSLVLHPHSPLIPSVHFNIRLFELTDGRYWFGGGIDLTPYVYALADFSDFHRKLRAAVTSVFPERYADFKRTCDEYFTLPHRAEMRGIGGVFFDRLSGAAEAEFALARALGQQFLPAWLPLAQRVKDDAFTQAQKDFQAFRHGRYVEFNLLYDRGTQFGLKTGGRAEAIFMSLPMTVTFRNQLPAAVAALAAELAPCYQPRDWCAAT